MTRNSDRDKAWSPNTPDVQEAEGDIQQLTPENNTKGFGEQTENSNEVTQVSNSLRDTGNNTTHIGFECELAVELRALDVEVGTSSDRNPRQDHVTMGRAHSSGSTNDYSLS